MAEENKTSRFSIGALGQTRIIAAILILAVLGGVTASMMLRSGSAQKALLYSGLDLSEASEIAGRLDQANISYEMRGDGSSIFVDRGQVLDARIMLSSEGLPTRGSVGYEVFDQQDALGATTFVQNVNRLRALEGELSRTITSLDNVKSARVHLVLPERRLFERESKEPSASIVVDVVGQSLNGAQIRAIRNLAAGAVPGLQAEHVTLLDGQGRLLAAGSSGENGAIGGLTADERRAMIEEDLRKKVLAQLEPVVGFGAARVQISADVDFNRVTRSSELFDPDGRVVRSTQTVEETNAETIRGRFGATTVEENLPDADEAAGTDEPTENAQSSRLEETINYEISRTTQTEIIEGGVVRRLSVAVAIDHLFEPGVADEEGNVAPATFTPRPAEDMAQLTALVRSAIGYDAERGDVLEVVNIRFAQPPLEQGTAASAPLVDFTKNDIIRSVEVIALLLGGLAAIFFVLRPLVAGLLSPPKPQLEVDPARAALEALAPEQREILERAELEARASNSELENSIDVANVTGQVKASSMKKIADVIEKHPDESVSILRNWLNERPEQGAA